jgi:hypothetical protein
MRSDTTKGDKGDATKGRATRCCFAPFMFRARCTGNRGEMGTKFHSYLPVRGGPHVGTVERRGAVGGNEKKKRMHLNQKKEKTDSDVVGPA